MDEVYYYWFTYTAYPETEQPLKETQEERGMDMIQYGLRQVKEDDQNNPKFCSTWVVDDSVLELPDLNFIWTKDF